MNYKKGFSAVPGFLISFLSAVLFLGSIYLLLFITLSQYPRICLLIVMALYLVTSTINNFIEEESFMSSNPQELLCVDNGARADLRGVDLYEVLQEKIRRTTHDTH